RADRGTAADLKPRHRAGRGLRRDTPGAAALHQRGRSGPPPVRDHHQGASAPRPRDRERRPLPAPVPRVDRRLDGRHRRARPAGPPPRGAEPMPAAVAAAHNHVLRRWLRGESTAPFREVDDALRLVIDLFPAPPATADDGTTVVAFRTGQDIETLIAALRRVT